MLKASWASCSDDASFPVAARIAVATCCLTAAAANACCPAGVPFAVLISARKAL